MIAYVDGTLEYIYEDRAVVDVNGMGINVLICAKTAALLPGVGNKIRLYTYTAVREDSFTLYGFINQDELELFKKLISVNGIGPKNALGLLSAFSADDLRFAILSADVNLISKAPGIGKKSAERIILDLKDKLKWNSDLVSKEISGNLNMTANSELSLVKNEAVAALTALGYNTSDAHRAVNAVEYSDDMDVEDVLKEALKQLI